MHIGGHGRGLCEPAAAILLHSRADFHVNLNGPMRIALLLGLCVTVHAAAIRGVVVEDAGGMPLARSLVVVQPIAGTGAPTQSVRSKDDGQFEFASLPAGAYLVLAQRRGFAPVQYGQKQWKGSGVPLVLDDAGAASLEIRLQRFGSIAGTVLDENDVGLPDHEVVTVLELYPSTISFWRRSIWPIATERCGKSLWDCKASPGSRTTNVTT